MPAGETNLRVASPTVLNSTEAAPFSTPGGAGNPCPGSLCSRRAQGFVEIRLFKGFGVVLASLVGAFLVMKCSRALSETETSPAAQRALANERHWYPVGMCGLLGADDSSTSEKVEGGGVETKAPLGLAGRTLGPFPVATAPQSFTVQALQAPAPPPGISLGAVSISQVGSASTAEEQPHIPFTFPSEEAPWFIAGPVRDEGLSGPFYGVPVGEPIPGPSQTGSYQGAPGHTPPLLFDQLSGVGGQFVRTSVLTSGQQSQIVQPAHVDASGELLPPKKLAKTAEHFGSSSQLPCIP
ncbi:hypothetical protein, conserved [Eimeria tenella]|uniref:Uncharacterized protein n=1 Tax=Eimeria tenella TaxID=5802 RepID=U6KG93_EIMTE|nr:hypothetical protein, conserved [Eimeria tenella]CDJ36949.1 hypothetical protein, conserved [Eimeria tenella]|eukprot:XP_013227787.1 hypothetical protein, conserved [Eimeria tenella]